MSVCVCVSLQCAELLKQAKTKYSSKDLMGALKLYEDVLAQVPAASMSHTFASPHLSTHTSQHHTVQSMRQHTV